MEWKRGFLRYCDGSVGVEECAVHAWGLVFVHTLLINIEMLDAVTADLNPVFGRVRDCSNPGMPCRTMIALQREGLVTRLQGPSSPKSAGSNLPRCNCLPAPSSCNHQLGSTHDQSGTGSCRIETTAVEDPRSQSHSPIDWVSHQR